MDLETRLAEHGSQSPSRGTILLLAVASASAVANLYYAQPLLATLGRAFHVPGNDAGIFMTLTQIGYAAGLFFLVPVGDLVDRRVLILTSFGLESVALMIAAFSQSAWMFGAASVAIGVMSVSAQIIVPYAAHIAQERKPGKDRWHRDERIAARYPVCPHVVGPRQPCCWMASGLPGGRRHHTWPHGHHVADSAVPARVRSGPFLPSPPVLGGGVVPVATGAETARRVRRLRVAAFSMFWTSVTFLLSGEPYRFSDALIGLLGLCGVAGAASASVAGRLSDRGWTLVGTGAMLVLTIVSFAFSASGSVALVGVIAGTILLDFGVQGTQILNQSQIYRLGAAERSRLTAAYMTPFFLGGAVGSAVSVLAYRAAGWAAVCITGAATAGIALLRWLFEVLFEARARGSAR